MKERKKKSVISAGHICLDITPAVLQGKKYNNISEFLVPGSLISVGKPDVHIGGSVGNTGLAMRILGADVKLMGKIGNDEFGTFLFCFALLLFRTPEISQTLVHQPGSIYQLI